MSEHWTQLSPSCFGESCTPSSFYTLAERSGHADEGVFVYLPWMCTSFLNFSKFFISLFSVFTFWFFLSKCQCPERATERTRRGRFVKMKGKVRGLKVNSTTAGSAPNTALFPFAMVPDGRKCQTKTRVEISTPLMSLILFPFQDRP